jgi:predicted dehydrogenase
VSAPRLGFVGLGWAGRHRMGSLLRSGAAEVAAVLDPSKAAVAETLRLAPKADVAETYDEMLKLDLDGVVISTPNALHAEQTILALERGMHVFCQKPLGRDAAEVKRMVDAAKRADRRLDVDLCYRHGAAMQAVRDGVRRGDIGEVFAMELVFHNAYGPDKAWFYDPDLSGGGCLLDLGIHMVDLGLWTLDFPRVKNVTSRLYSQGRPLRGRERAVDDYALARLDLETGATAHVACSWKVSQGCDAVIQVVFHGANGALRMQNVNGSYFDFRAERLHGTRSEVLVGPGDDWSGRAIEEWARAIGRGEGFSRESERHAEVADVLDRVYAG